MQHNALLFHQTEIDSYLAAWVAELLRRNLLLAQQTLTFEAIMSHPSKLEFLREARALGYRAYLYFVATNDPNLNVARVRRRVLQRAATQWLLIESSTVTIVRWN